MFCSNMRVAHHLLKINVRNVPIRKATKEVKTRARLQERSGKQKAHSVLVNDGSHLKKEIIVATKARATELHNTSRANADPLTKMRHPHQVNAFLAE
mmetsp:Transcript_10384/g.16945  ORF Transcript_10384/g.16945 Transcript_10384/m.16945 type:complete len:97 (-) Transcript_10384:405-695(-)